MVSQPVPRSLSVILVECGLSGGILIQCRKRRIYPLVRIIRMVMDHGGVERK